MKIFDFRILVCMIVAIVLLLLYFGHPESESWWLKCPFYRFWGWQCPFCGSQRAVHAFLHGRFAEAWGYNPGLWVSLPYGGLFLLGQCSCRWREWWPVQWSCRNKVVLGFFLLAVGWGIARNLWL